MADRRTRVVLPGATLADVVHSPDVEPFEHESCAEPNEAWYDPDLAPSRPTHVELLVYNVPKGRGLILLDFSIEAFVPSAFGGVSAAPAPDRAMWRTIGYTFQAKDKTPGVVMFDLEPVPTTNQRSRYRPVPDRLRAINEITTGDFARTRSRTYAGGTGAAMLPPRTGRYGTLGAPWSVFLSEQEQAVIQAVIFRPLPFPVAFIEAKMTGYIGGRNTIARLLADLQAPLENAT